MDNQILHELKMQNNFLNQIRENTEEIKKVLKEINNGLHTKQH